MKKKDIKVRFSLLPRTCHGCRVSGFFARAGRQYMPGLSHIPAVSFPSCDPRQAPVYLHPESDGNRHPGIFARDSSRLGHAAAPVLSTLIGNVNAGRRLRKGLMFGDLSANSLRCLFSVSFRIYFVFNYN